MKTQTAKPARDPMAQPFVATPLAGALPPGTLERVHRQRRASTLGRGSRPQPVPYRHIPISGHIPGVL